MKIQRTSPLTHKKHTREIDVAPGKYEYWLATDRNDRPLIQHYFPELSADDREFLLTGIPKEEWAQFDEENDQLVAEISKRYREDGTPK